MQMIALVMTTIHNHERKCKIHKKITPNISTFVLDEKEMQH